MDVVDDVDDVGDGDIALSREERELLVWLSRGYDVAHIAERTCYSAGWIYTRLRDVRVALGVRTDVGAVVEGLRLGLIGLPKKEEIWR